MGKFRFTIETKRGPARTGRLDTPHGQIETPVFMPVGTKATVKSLTPDQVWETGVRILLSNAYHLHLRPGPEVIEALGGLHSFMGWPGAILTDSGGFQIISLGGLIRIEDEAVRFRSHIDGSLVIFTPEQSVRTQVALGADIIMCLDQPVQYPASREQAADAARRTVLWARRSREIAVPDHQALFGIVQGSVYTDLREWCARELCRLDFPGYALGGLSVGEPAEEFYRVMRETAAMLPEDRPRYLMGVGHPLDLVEGAAAGIDMFDCVLPTRNARHGRAYTFAGSLNLKNAVHRNDSSPLEEGCPCYTCSKFSRGYIRHLLQEDEALGRTLLTIHNLRFFFRLMEKIRNGIRSGCMESVKEDIRRVYPRKGYGEAVSKD